MLTTLLYLAVGFVAFTNGANANFKGVASLYGTGTTTRWRALLWGTAATFAGSLTAAVLAQGLIKTFSGRGLVPDTLLQTPHYMCAVAVGAALTSFLATRLGFPVSTTHALVGALVGAGWMGSGSEMKLAALGKDFLYPLFFTPALAAVLGAVAYPALRVLRLAPHQRIPLLDLMHYLSTGAASFARGLNDTPKIAALLFMVPREQMTYVFLGLAIVIALGGLLDAKNVAETLAKKVTDMDPGQGFAASLVTACLVTTASIHSLPASTTHVSVGSLLGIGATTGQAKWRKIGEIMFAWISTVPCGALLGAIAYAFLSRV